MDKATVERFRDLFENTQLTMREIRDTLYDEGLRWTWMWEIAKQEYTDEERCQRKSENYRRSKLGSKNPMKGKTGDKHHNYLGDDVEWVDGDGYICIRKPEWYTSRRGSSSVYKHHIVVCQLLGLTEIPQGFVVHHIDRDRRNNDSNNLALMTLSAHNRLHALERATTIRKE